MHGLRFNHAAMHGLRFNYAALEVNAQIAYSNEYIRNELEAAATHVRDNIGKWQQSYNNVHALTMRPSTHDPFMVHDLFEQSRGKCDQYDDTVHHCELAPGHILDVLGRLCMQCQGPGCSTEA